MNPYICEYCGGGFNRCGNMNCQEINCIGSQYCWEDEAVLIIEGTKINNYQDESIGIWRGKDWRGNKKGRVQVEAIG
jgi:hypothetical protein